MLIAELNPFNAFRCGLIASTISRDQMSSYLVILAILVIFLYFVYNQDKLPDWLTRKKGSTAEADTCETEETDEYKGCRASRHLKKQRD